MSDLKDELAFIYDRGWLQQSCMSENVGGVELRPTVPNNLDLVELILTHGVWVE